MFNPEIDSDSALKQLSTLLGEMSTTEKDAAAAMLVVGTLASVHDTAIDINDPEFSDAIMKASIFSALCVYTMIHKIPTELMAPTKGADLLDSLHETVKAACSEHFKDRLRNN